MTALSIRRDRTPTVLRKLARCEPDARVGRRILAIANALDGMSREDAARSAGMDRQTLRDWVIRYNEHGLDGSLTNRAPGARPSSIAKRRPSCWRSSSPDRIRKRAAFRLSRATIWWHLRGEVRQKPARDLDRPHPARPRALAAEGAAEPSAKGPGRPSGL